MAKVRLHARQVQCATQLSPARHRAGELRGRVSRATTPSSAITTPTAATAPAKITKVPAGPRSSNRITPRLPSGIYHCPSFPDDTINYFLGVHWLRIHEGRFDLMTSDIRHSSEYILSGDCAHARLYCPPFGQSQLYKFTDDCDKDDMLWNCLAYFGEDYGMWAHPAGNNVLFGDYHVAAYRKFDPKYMTYNPKQLGQDFGDITPP